MGTWNTGAFDNDFAMDLLAEYEADGPEALVRWFGQWDKPFAPPPPPKVSWLDRLLGRTPKAPAPLNMPEGFIDADLGVSAVVAGEIIAAAHGRTGGAKILGQDDTLGEALLAHGEAVRSQTGLLDEAKQKVSASLLDLELSELAMLWDDAEAADNKAFRTGLTDLIERIEAIQL